MAEPGWLTREAFSSACAALPLVSIDFYIIRSHERGSELLLGQRRNPPAQGWWFTPGGRIRKNESLSDARKRIAREEVGVAPALLSDAELLGVLDHFYPDSAFDPAVSTHYVNLAYLLRLAGPGIADLPRTQGTGAQHGAWQWMPLGEAVAHPAVHENVRAVVRELMHFDAVVEAHC